MRRRRGENVQRYRVAGHWHLPNRLKVPVAVHRLCCGCSFVYADERLGFGTILEEFLHACPSYAAPALGLSHRQLVHHESILRRRKGGGRLRTALQLRQDALPWGVVAQSVGQSEPHQLSVYSRRHQAAVAGEHRRTPFCDGSEIARVFEIRSSGEARDEQIRDVVPIGRRRRLRE